MDPRGPLEAAPLEIDMARRIDAVCRRFEADWRGGRQPCVRDYLDDVPEEGRAALRAELEALDRELRQSDATIAPASLPTAPIAGLANPSVHEEPTVAPGGPPTVDLGSSGTIRPGASSTDRVRYFGDYEIDRELARGGMGVVFEARQVSLNRKVALKMILAGQLANEIDVKRFYTEAEAAASLDHPGIVPIYEVGRHEGQHYFSMGFVEGQSLSQRLADGPLPPREAAELMIKVAEAIEYAHSRGVIHRDLKPGNILLDRQGNPRVTDFGLAKKLEGDSGLTGSGQIMGTPSYMPPEQAGGNRGEVGPAADVYALGATLYALVTGRPPFQAATAMDTVLQVVGEEPVPPRRLNATIPRDLETICLKCLEKEPARRYESAAAMGGDLRRFLNGEPILARPVGLAERAWRWCRRNPAVAGLAAAVVLALVLGTAVASAFAVRANRNATQARANLILANQETARANEAALKAAEEAHRADDEADLAREAKQLSDRRRYVAEINLAQQAWTEANLVEVRRLLDAQRPQSPGDADPRGFEWYDLDRLREADLRALRVSSQSARFSPDGRTLALAGDADGTIRLADVATGEQRLVLRGHSEPVNDVAYSPDGRTLASAGQDKVIKLWDATSGKEMGTLTGHTFPVNGVAFRRPDGRMLASASSDLSVRLWDTATGKPVHTLRGHANQVFAVAFSPDGRILASAGADRMVKLWDPDAGREIRTLRDADSFVGRVAFSFIGRVAFSPDGHVLATGSTDQTVKLWDPATGKGGLVLRGHEGGILDVAFSPDGRTIASASLDRTVKLWDVAPGREIRTLRGHEAPAESVSFSPDGRILASAGKDTTVRLWDVRAGEDPRVLVKQRGQVIAVAYSPDGRILASADWSGVTKLWDSAMGREIRALGRDEFFATYISNKVIFSPDGRTLISSFYNGGTGRIWDVATGREVKPLDFGTAVSDATLSPDGRTLAWIGGGPSDHSIRFWDVATWREIGTISGHSAKVEAVCFSPDGRILASAGQDKVIKLWGPATRNEIRTLAGHTERVTAVAFNPDGHRLASASWDGTVRIWDVDTGKAIDTLVGQGIDSRLAFSPDGRTLAHADGKGVIRIRDLVTAQEVLTLDGRHGPLNGIAFRPDGRQLAAAAQDGTVLLWDAAPLTPELRLLREARSVVEFLAAQKLPAAEVAARIRRNPTISDAVRARALELAEHLP